MSNGLKAPRQAQGGAWHSLIAGEVAGRAAGTVLGSSKGEGAAPPPRCREPQRSPHVHSLLQNPLLLQRASHAPPSLEQPRGRVHPAKLRHHAWAAASICCCSQASAAPDPKGLSVWIAGTTRRYGRTGLVANDLCGYGGAAQGDPQRAGAGAAPGSPGWGEGLLAAMGPGP